jgi:hypothetical protein
MMVILTIALYLMLGGKIFDLSDEDRAALGVIMNALGCNNLLSLLRDLRRVLH